MIKKILNKKLIKYLIVSFGGLFLDFITLFIMYSYFLFPKEISLIMGFTISNLSKYFLNQYFTFEMRNEKFSTRRFVIYWCFIIGGDTLAFVTILSINHFINDLFICKILSLIVSFIYGYYVSKKYIFRSTQN